MLFDDEMVRLKDFLERLVSAVKNEILGLDALKDMEFTKPADAVEFFAGLQQYLYAA